MAQTENLEVAKDRLDYNVFAPQFGEWAPKFKPFIEGKEMWDIYQTLKTDAFEEREVDGKKKFFRKTHIYPEKQNTFRSFATTRPQEVRAIFFLMDPYARTYKGGIPQATGIPMDCSNAPDGKLQPSLTKFYDAMSKTIGHRVEYSPDLTYLHEQGVMLMNSDLTVKAGKTGSHKGLWKPFMKYFLEEVLASYPGIYYVLCGKDSEVLKRYINPFAKVSILTHPSFANRSGIDWDDKGIFNTINKHLTDQLGPDYKIFWDKRDWEANKPPF